MLGTERDLNVTIELATLEHTISNTKEAKLFYNKTINKYKEGVSRTEKKESAIEKNNMYRNNNN